MYDSPRGGARRAIRPGITAVETLTSDSELLDCFVALIFDFDFDWDRLAVEVELQKPGQGRGNQLK